MTPDLLSSLEGQLIVSCQAWDGDPFRDPISMARFAQAAVAGGAKGIRANSPEDIAAIRGVVDVPIIGIQKVMQPDGRFLITPSFEAARLLKDAGADMIALDCTVRGQKTGALERLARIRQHLNLPALADIATVAEAEAAIEAGADAVLSTMRGYTGETAGVTGFEPGFVRILADIADIPVIAEGRIHSPAEAKSALNAGAFAVIIGSAITRPADLTRSFARAIASAPNRRAKSRYFAAVDLGGTNVKFGLVSSGGDLLWSGVHPTPVQGGRSALLDTLRQAVTETQKEAEQRGLTVASVGIATAGWVNAITGEIAYATENLRGWTGTQVAKEIKKVCHLPVSVENDANALAVAEKHFGIAKDLTDFVVITLGTGVGGGCYIGGRLNRGAHFFANAIGHIPLIPDGLACSCGRNGCLETYTNLEALLRYAGPGYSSPEQVAQAAASGQTVAIEALQTFAGYLARGCASVVSLLDPHAIILSGGVAVNNPILAEALLTCLRFLVPTWERRDLSVSISRLGYYGGVLGAAAIAAEQERGALWSG